MTPDRSAPALVDAVVSTQWLADHLGSERLVVLDASVIVLGADSSTASGKTTYLSGYDQYLFDGHIPGAVFGDLVESFSEQGAAYPFTRPSLETFTEAARAAGVGDDCTIVVYDTAYGQFASRLWWLFRSFGHARVAVLDGGFVRWRAEGRPIDDGHVEPIDGSFTAREDTRHWVDKAFVEAVLRGEERAVLVCGVPPREFSGETGGRARPGHIPGSFNVPAGRLVDRATNSSVPLAELRERFAPALASAAPGTRIVAYCAGGVTSAADALALTRLGVTDVAVYDGSLAEWSADADAPLVTGA
ncbi:sulfurtransferase [Plantibacter sp. YIM 135249]|uniref:sulfurtransferase n=1 Tax=Plantibacter sp. YIM 135249 TaxID=3423918 RepID=UPI003D34B357